MKNINTKKGFTIIEVVLVLAIAGLIFLMVFVALPNLQISQRDTQRRDDVAKLATAITQYQSNNGGKLPTTATIAATSASSADADTGFRGKYLTSGGQQFSDPLEGKYYRLVIIDFDTSKTKADDYLKQGTASVTYKDGMAIIKKAKCGEDGVIASNSSERAYAAVMKLEGSGYYCTSN